MLIFEVVYDRFLGQVSILLLVMIEVYGQIDYSIRFIFLLLKEQKAKIYSL